MQWNARPHGLGTTSPWPLPPNGLASVSAHCDAASPRVDSRHTEAALASFVSTRPMWIG